MKIHIAGENALILYFAEQTSPQVAAIIQKAVTLLQKDCHDVIIDLVPSYASLLITFDLFKCDHHQLRRRIRTSLLGITSVDKVKGKLVKLPVYYDEKIGVDLIRIAEKAQLTIAEVISIHQSLEYQVYAIGFAPGFAYLGEVDQRIAMPRLETPRAKVPKGAVAIADKQTAVYPSISPGGWNIIGLCPVEMFNIKNTPAMPVSVGDRVKFFSVSKKDFVNLGGQL